MEEIAVDEIREKIPTVEALRIERGVRHGRVFFTLRRSPKVLETLRAPMTIYGQLADFAGITPGKPGLERLLARALGSDIAAGGRLYKACRGTDPTCIGLNVRLQGRHRFDKAEVVSSLRQGLIQRHGLGLGEGGPLLVLQVENKRALWGIQLYRSRRNLGGGGNQIQGPLAYGLGRILDLADDDLVLLPEGTQAGLSALREAVPSTRLVFTDGQPTRSSGEQEWPSAIAAWGVKAAMAALPLRDTCVDAVLASFKLSKANDVAKENQSKDQSSEAQSGLSDENLASEQLEEYARVLQPGGMAVIMCAWPQLVLGLVEALDLPLGVVARLPIGLRGRELTILMLERLEEVEPGGGLLQIDGLGG
jgi:hypothetical protein